MRHDINQAKPAILVVDDDANIRETFTTILQSAGYATSSATNAKETLEVIRTRFFDLALLDVRLPDKQGTQLLVEISKLAPETIRIMITGYPSVETATEAINGGADLYLTKPIHPDDLLEAIGAKLKERDQRERITGTKMVEWARQRARKAHSTGIQELSEKMAKDLSLFGLTRTQAKIYTGLCALGAASASEIAALSEIRREEVYRALPELEKRGLVTARLGMPRRFLATEPPKALKILVRAKLDKLRGETDALERKKEELVSQLERITLRTGEEQSSFEVLSQQDNATLRFMNMMRKASSQLLLATSFDDLERTFFERSTGIGVDSHSKVNARIVIEKLDDLELARLSKSSLHLSEQSEFRQVKALPFVLLIVDDKEAMWGELHSIDVNAQVLWTNHQTQIAVLRMAFENLWERSYPLV